MKLVFFANGGSPTGITPLDYWGEGGQIGLGGAEAALIWIAHHLAERGHEVEVYNDPKVADVYGAVRYRPLAEFDMTQPIDAMILFRNPWMGVAQTNAKTKVFWSCDQQTAGDYATHVFPWVDHTICISPYHLGYHIERYGMDANTAWVTNLGANWDEYKRKQPKIKNRLIYCSVPGRGLKILWAAFPFIREQVPDVSLTITADYRLWGVDYAGDEDDRAMWQTYAEEDNINYVGAVPHRELAKLQLEAEICAFPGDYEEMFCIAIAECQMAGAVPVTSTLGAIPSTTGVGINIAEHPKTPAFRERFAEAIVDLLQNRSRLEGMQVKARRYAIQHFKWEGIAEAWEKKLIEWITA